jgi:hypothetical protein
MIAKSRRRKDYSKVMQKTTATISTASRNIIEKRLRTQLGTQLPESMT